MVNFMKKILIPVILVLFACCTNKVDRPKVSNKECTKEIIVDLKSKYILQNRKLLGFIDSFIERCRKFESIDSLDIDNNIYMLYVYQNDLFTRVKLSFISPTKDYIKFISKGTGYFEYKGRIFILLTGLDRLCAPDSSLQMEFQSKIKDRIINFERQVERDNYKVKYLQPITWEADIVGDTIFIKKGTRNPYDPPPSDTAELYNYIRSVKSFTY